MKRRLVSQGLQDRLDEISGGDFTRRFNAVASTEPKAFSHPRAITFELKHNTRVLISIEITPDMIAEPCEPLPVDYWHPDQIAARRYMGEEDDACQ